MNEKKYCGNRRGAELRIVTCAKCGYEWNISRYAQVRNHVYICPKCRFKERRNGS